MSNQQQQHDDDDDRNVDFEKLKDLIQKLEDRIQYLETFAILMNNTNERDIWNMILKEGRRTYEWMRSDQ